MICPNCKQEIGYDQLLDAKNSRICPLCLGVVFECNHDVKEKLMKARGMVQKTIKRECPECGGTIKDSGKICNRCRGRNGGLSKRKAIIMSGKPKYEVPGAPFDEPLPVDPVQEHVLQPKITPYELPQELQVFRDAAIERSADPERVINPDPIMEITAWRRKAILWDTFSDRLNHTLTELMMLKNEIERSA